MRTLILSLAVAFANLSAESLMNNAAGTVSIPVMDWTDVTPVGVAPDQITTYDDAFYVPALHAYCTDGSYREASTEPNRSWSCYSFRENRWQIMDVAGTWANEHLPEGGHSVGRLRVDPTTSVSMGQCCFSGSQVSEIVKGGNYQYDFLAQVGIPRLAAHSLRYDGQLGSSTFDVYRNKLLEFAGGSFQGLMVYDPTTNDRTVSPIATSCVGACPDSSLNNHSMAFDYNDGNTYLFGGSVGAPVVLQDKLYKYNHATTTWTLITPTSCSPSCPSARENAGLAYDPDDDVLMLRSGCITDPAPGCTLAQDTWIYDIKANTWTQITTTHNPASVYAPFEELIYDWDDHVFLLYDNQNPTGADIHTWAFRYKSGSKAGSLRRTYGYTPGTISRNAPVSGPTDQNNTSVSYGGSVSGSGSTLYQIWGETTIGNAATNGRLMHPYARTVTGTTATKLGSGYTALTNDAASELEAFDPAIAVVSGVPWACWEDQNTSTTDRVKCKGYSSGSWSLGGTVPIQSVNAFDGFPRVIDNAGTPTIALREQDRTTGGTPPTIFGYVYQYSNGTFNLMGSALNATGTLMSSLAIASDGTNPWVAYTAYTPTATSEGITFTFPQVFLKKWNGSSWDAWCSGNSANISAGLGWATSVSVTVMGGVPYVAFSERLAAGNLNKLYVRTCSGVAGAWSTVGSGTGYRNVDQFLGWTFWNDLQNDGTNLYLAWTEQAIGQSWVSGLSFQTSRSVRPRVYVAKWNGTTWSRLGGTLNMDPQNGSATHPALAIYNSQPAVQWGEVNYGAHRQMYAKAWTGTDWQPLGAGGGGGTPPTITTSSLPSTAKNLTSYSQTLAATGDTPITWSITSGALPTGLSLNSGTGAITGTATGSVGTSNFTVQASNAAGTNSQALSIVVRNPNVPTDYANFQAGLTGIAALGCGNTLAVDAGVYTENVTVPASNCTLANPITVQSNSAIPQAGVRITPNYLDPAPRIPVLQGSAAGTVMRFKFGDTQSKGWLFKGIGVNCSLNAPSQICVEVGTQDGQAFGQSMANPYTATSANLPSDIAFDHCILRGSRLGMVRVGMQLNGQNLKVVDSWLGDLWDVTASDGQAIRSLSGDGPINIINTYLDGQTETLGVGGTGSIITTPSTFYGPFVSFTTAGSIPGNITVDQSHLTHGLWLRYDGMNPYAWAPAQLTRMGQVWIAYTNNDSSQTRIGVYQATNMGVTGSSFPTKSCTNALGCTFSDGTITWRGISNFGGGETYIGSGIAKNLAECKQCGPWTIKRSFLQHAWEGGGGGGAQGFALTFSHRTNVAPYSVMGPITFKDNVIDDVAGVLQASAFGDDADANIYPTVRSSIASPYTITAGNNTLVVDGTTITLTPGTRTAAQVAEEINAALPHLTVSSVSAPVDNNPYWTKYMLTLSGNVSYAMSYDAAPILAAVRNGITRTDLGQSADNSAIQIWCTWDSLYNGGSGRAICDGAGQNQVEFLYPYGARISVSPGATIATPTVASAYHDGSTNSDYLVIVKGQYVSALPISGSAAVSVGLPSTTVFYCTQPVTRKWYGCGVSKGVSFVNNLITNASTDSNKFAVWRAPYLIWPSNIHPLEISHNTFDYQYGTAFLGQGVPSSGVIRNNAVLFRSAASTGESSYFNDGRQSGLSWIHSYLCAPPLDETNIGAYNWMANGSTLPDCPSGVASGNLLPGATLYSAEVLPHGSVFGSSAAAPKSTINAPLANVVFTPGSYKLAPSGTPYLPPGSYNLFGSQTASGWAGGSLELGTKFKADVDGQITKLRYFHPANCPAETRTGSLWTGTGTLLATGSFPPGVPGAWVEMVLPAPVKITAGATYVASYHTATCWAINMQDLSQAYGAFPVHVVTPGSVYSGNGFPSSGDTMGHAADVVFVATGTIPTGTNGTIGSAQAKASADYTDIGVDMSKLPLIRNLQVTYSDRAAIVSWLDSEVSQNIPGVLRLCKTDPDYDPVCAPAGSIVSADTVTGALADNSDNDTSPKNGLQRYIVVSGLAANTKYYAQLYRGGHYRAFSFTTLSSLSGSASVSFSRTASGNMGAVANMAANYGAAYSRLSGSITGSTASVPCSTGSSCSATVTAAAGVALYLQPQMRNSAGALLYSYPVSVMIPGGTTVNP